MSLHLRSSLGRCVQHILNTGNRVVNESPLRRIAGCRKGPHRPPRLFGARPSFAIAIGRTARLSSYVGTISERLTTFSCNCRRIRRSRYGLPAEVHLRADEVEHRIAWRPSFAIAI